MEEVAFAIHPAVIRQLIENQAGTLPKAILEGVMNGADAMAFRKNTEEKPRIDIQLTPSMVTITDNGCGFRTREEVLTVFKTFGLPHEEQKRFARFRVGRGQLFAQGRTTYTSNQFRMFVDYRSCSEEDGNELGFQLTDDGDYGDGVTVRVEFYDDQVPRSGDHHKAIEEITRAIRYMSDVDIYLNDELLNLDPVDCDWTLEDDVAWYRLTTTGGDVDIYSDGVFVERVSSYEWGVSGTIVSKEALPVNQARNQVNRTSGGKWRHIQKVCKEYAGVKVRRKQSNLAEHEVQSILRDLVRHPKPKFRKWEPNQTEEERLRNSEAWDAFHAAWDDIDSLRIWKDVDGKMWSINTLRREIGKAGKIDKRPSGHIAVAFAPVGDVKASNANRGYHGLVLDDYLLELFSCDAETFINDVLGIRLSGIEHKMLPMDVPDIMKGLSSVFKLFPEKDWRPRERWILKALTGVSWTVTGALNRQRGLQWGDPNRLDCRKLVVGAGLSDLWTDGETYIGMNRSWLESFGQLTPAVFEILSRNIVWQYCFSSSNEERAETTAEQREMFHDILLNTQEGFGFEAWKAHINLLQRDGKKIPGKHIKRVREMEEAAEIEFAYIDWKKEEAEAFDAMQSRAAG